MFQSGCHGNQVSIAMRYETDAYLLSQGISIQKKHQIELKTNELLMFHSGCHGNRVPTGTWYDADAIVPMNLHTKYRLNMT